MLRNKILSILVFGFAVLALPSAVSAQTTVLPTVETGACQDSTSSADVCDDSAIWIHPTNSAQSTVIGDDKNGGLLVWDLQGNQLQYIESSINMNNLDVRYNFPLTGSYSTGQSHTKVDLMAVVNEEGGSLAFYKINPNTRLLEKITEYKLNKSNPYGGCLYHSPVTGKYHFFVNWQDGVWQQVELSGGSTINGTVVRTHDAGSQTEGCVADDVHRYYYIGVEAQGVWRYGAEPGDGISRVSVDNTSGNLRADVEGMSLYYKSNGDGYLIVSSQGASKFDVYQRRPSSSSAANSYIGAFKVGTNGSIDAVSSTDGLDVTNFPLGSTFPNGLFVAHDASNSGGSKSNHKYVPFERIASALSLTMDTSWNPRNVGGSGPTPTPFPSVTGDPTPSPTPTKSPTPSPTQTATATPFPSITGDPTPSPTPIPGTCQTVDSGYYNNQIPQQTGTFTITFRAVPNGSNVDTVFGLSHDQAGTYSDMATIVRFTPNGTIDARNGSVYQANSTINYSSGQSYTFKLVVNVANKTYSAYVTPQGGSEQTIGTNYAFRTEQNSVASLNYVSTHSGDGSSQICNISMGTSGGGSGLPGDGNGDNKVDGLDYVVWVNNYGASTNQGSSKGDYSGNGTVDGQDYVIWVNNYGRTGTATSTAAPTTPPSTQTATATATAKPSTTSTATATATSTATAAPTSSSNPTIVPSTGIWLSPSEITKLPTSGAGWNNVLSAANSSWGSANLGDNNSSHDVKTLAGALVAVRNNDTAMRNKTIQGLQSAMNSGTSRTLELARGLQTYVVAADIIGYRTPQFEAWVNEMLTDTSISGRRGGGLYNNALVDPTNWGGHERAASFAAARYLGDTAKMNELAKAYREFVGENVSPKRMSYDNTNWHADPNNKAGVNRKGSSIQGHDVSGSLPEDWRRAGEFKWPPAITGYMWEGMQGYVVTAVMMARANLVPLTAGDNAVVRSMDILYRIGNTPSSDDGWIPWLVNYYWGTNYPTSTSVGPGKGMGYTEWTHAK